MPRGWIDTHAHFWDGGLVAKAWNPPPPLCGTHSPAAWADEMARFPVGECIFGETGRTPEEVALLESWTADHPAVVGFVAPLAVDGSDINRIVARWAESATFRGVRAHFEDERGELVLTRNLETAFRGIAETGRVFDFLVVAEQLPFVHRCCLTVPDLRAVVEHMGKPRVAGPVDAAWRASMAALAADTGAVVKLSLSPRPDEFADLVARHPAGFPAEGVRRHVDVLLELFGPERLVWGSDWPVSVLTAATGDFMSEWLRILGPLGPLLGETARRVYGLANAHTEDPDGS